jgi:hypothetical protein
MVKVLKLAGVGSYGGLGCCDVEPYRACNKIAVPLGYDGNCPAQRTHAVAFRDAVRARAIKLSSGGNITDHAQSTGRKGFCVLFCLPYAQIVLMMAWDLMHVGKLPKTTNQFLAGKRRPKLARHVAKKMSDICEGLEVEGAQKVRLLVQNIHSNVISMRRNMYYTCVRGIPLITLPNLQDS